MKSKILIVTDYGTPSGGAELVSLKLRDELRGRGHDARIFSTTARPVPLPIESDYQCVGTTSRWRTLLQSANPWAARSLAQVLAEFDPDIVHVRQFLTQLSPLILPLLRSRAAILHLETYRSICPTGTKLLPDSSQCTRPRGVVCWRAGCVPLRDWIPLTAQMAMADRHRHVFDAIVANSRWMQSQFEQAGVRIDDVIWNGIEIPDAMPEFAVRPKIAFAGRLVETKGVGVLLRAMSKVSATVGDAHLVIVGDGPMRTESEILAKRLGISSRVEFTGHLNRVESEKRLAGAWIQVIPSVWGEPFGLVTVEAMARGSCAIATDIGGSKELIRHDHNGLLVPPNDAESLGTAIVSVLHDKSLRHKFRENGRRFVRENCSLKAFGDSVESVYERVLSKRASAQASLARDRHYGTQT